MSPTFTRLWSIYYEQAQRVPETNATQPCPCLRQGEQCITHRKRVLGQGPDPGPQWPPHGLLRAGLGVGVFLWCCLCRRTCTDLRFRRAAWQGIG